MVPPKDGYKDTGAFGKLLRLIDSADIFWRVQYNAKRRHWRRTKLNI
jgi:hypothetical protein